MIATSIFSSPKPFIHTQIIKQPKVSFVLKSQKSYGFQSLQIGGNQSRNSVVSTHLTSYHEAHHLIPPRPQTTIYPRNKTGGPVGLWRTQEYQPGAPAPTNFLRFSLLFLFLFIVVTHPFTFGVGFATANLGYSSTNSNTKTHKRKGEDDLKDEQPPKRRQSSAFESPFPIIDRQQSDVEPRPNVPPVIHASNVIITDVHLRLIRGFHHHPTIRTPLREFQEKYESWLLDHLKELSKGEQTLEVALEMAALVNLLKLFNYSHDLEKQKLVSKASEGAQKLQEGLIQVKEGQDLLQNAIVELLKSMG